MANTYHPTLSDVKALELVRAAVQVRSLAIKIVADMRNQPNAPRYGRPLISPPPLVSASSISGLSLFVEGLPLMISSEWGSIQIAKSCTDEVTPEQCKHVLGQLAKCGVVLDIDGDPDTEYMFTADIVKVSKVSLPSVSHRGGRAFRTFAEAKQAFAAACRAL